MAGKRQKPSTQLQGHRPKPDALELVRDEPRVIPPAPRGLHTVARKAWKDFFSSPLAQVIDMAADGEAIRHWARCISERELFMEELKDSPLARGSMGQLVKHPLWDVVKELNRQIEKYREQFGMSPLARLRLGVAYSEADEALARMERRRSQMAEPVMVEIEYHSGKARSGNES